MWLGYPLSYGLTSSSVLYASITSLLISLSSSSITTNIRSVIIDSRVIRNYILLVAVKRIGLLYRYKRDLYLLVTILGDLIAYKGGIINLKIGLI
jgi:hypothetical protein